jgi:hypothetical protein
VARARAAVTRLVRVAGAPAGAVLSGMGLAGMGLAGAVLAGAVLAGAGPTAPGQAGFPAAAATRG